MSKSSSRTRVLPSAHSLLVFLRADGRSWRVVIGVLCSGFLVASAATVAGAETWVEPVDAVVVDSFRPPETRFGAGNRGIEYGLSDETDIRAVAPGIVTFSGAVGGARFVVIQHADGLRSTYAYLVASNVIRGQQVAQGQVIAVAGRGFHLTARLGDRYVDPALLFGGAEVVLRLSDGVPAPAVAARSTKADSRAAMWQSVGELTPSSLIGDMAEGAAAWHHQDCTADDVAVSSVSSDRLAIQVGGLGSSSESASIGELELPALGYEPDNVVGFSYGGGCTPEPFGSVVSGGESLTQTLEQSSYGPQDTYGDLHDSARRLADLVDDVARARPGAPIDIVAHSLGGVVARLALELLAERNGGHVPIEVMMTVGSPHQGADLGTAAVIAADSELLSGVVGSVMPGGPEQLGAESVRQVGEAGADHLPQPGEPPEGVRVVAVSGSTDLIVPAEAARWEGAVNSLVDTGLLAAGQAHSRLPGRSEVARELELAVAGIAPRCVALATVLRGTAKAGAVDLLENAAGVLVGIATWVF